MYVDRTTSRIYFSIPKEIGYFNNDSTGKTVTLPDGTNVTAHKYASIINLGGSLNYYRLYVYEDSATSPEPDVLCDGISYFFLIKDPNTPADASGYAYFITKNNNLAPSLSTIKDDIIRKHTYRGKPSGAVAGTSITIPSGAVNNVDITNLISTSNGGSYMKRIDTDYFQPGTNLAQYHSEIDIVYKNPNTNNIYILNFNT